jgi:hypothetical protein
MPNVIRVRWTVTPKIAPQPWRPCSRCGTQRPFRCSGKFRLNANGKQLDAWLIYKCRECDETWNRAVVERRAARDLGPGLLAALEANDPALVRRLAFDVAGLRKGAHRVEEFGELQVWKQLLDGIHHTSGATSLEISLLVPIQVSLRLDRLLATELGLSRSRIATLAEADRLRTTVSLNKAARNGIRVEIDLSTDQISAVLLDAALTNEEIIPSLS